MYFLNFLHGFSHVCFIPWLEIGFSLVFRNHDVTLTVLNNCWQETKFNENEEQMTLNYTVSLVSPNNVTLRAKWNVPLCLKRLVPLCPKAKNFKNVIYAQKGLKIAEILCSFCPKIIIFSLKPYCHKLAGTRTFLLLHTKGQILQRKPRK